MKRNLIIGFAVLILLFIILFLLRRKGRELDVTPLHPPDYFAKLVDLLNDAKDSVYIAMMDFHFTHHEGEGPDSLYRVLKKIAARGVKVVCVLESGEKHLGEKFERRVDEMVDSLRKAGITVIPDKIGKSTHAKLIVVDGRITIVGSSNWTYWGMLRNNESNVLIRSPKVARYFLRYINDSIIEPARLDRGRETQ